MEASDRGLELARRVGDRVWEEGFLLGPISGDVLLGQWDEGLAREVELGREGDVSLKTPLVIAECARGDVERARIRVDSYEPSERLRRPSGALRLPVRRGARAAGGGEAAGGARIARADASPDGFGVTFLTMKLALVEALEAAFALGDTAKLEELLASIETLRPGDRPRLLDAHARPVPVEAERRRSRLSRPHRRVFRELEVPFWLAVTLLEHGEATASAPLLAEARELFAKLDATPWLERLERALESGREPEPVGA